MRKDLLFFMPSLKVGGAERMVQRLILGLQHKHKCTLVYISHNESGQTLEFPDSVTLIPLTAKRTRSAFKEIYNLINHLEPDIIFSSWSRSNLLLLCLKPFLSKSIKFIIREPNLPSFTLPTFKAATIYKILYSYLYPKADLVICQSHEMKNELIDFFSVPASKLKVIHNILPISDIQKKALEEINEFEINENDFIGCGRLEYQKGFDLLLLAFIKVLQRHSSARLIIFGDGSMRSNLQSVINEHKLENSILLPGETINPFKFMKGCGTYISSSRWEGLPNTVLEAMACGANILATNCPGATAEIIEHGINGWLIPANDIDALALGIEKCFSAEWRLNASVVMEYAKKFDTNIIISEYEAALLSVLN